jgi:hypothetical protein
MHERESILSLFLPKGILDWFEVKEGKSDENNVYITLEEKTFLRLRKKTGAKKSNQ